MSATAATASVEAALAHGLRMLERDPLLAAEQMVTAMSANWQRFCNQMNKAA